MYLLTLISLLPMLLGLIIFIAEIIVLPIFITYKLTKISEINNKKLAKSLGLAFIIAFSCFTMFVLSTVYDLKGLWFISVVCGFCFFFIVLPIWFFTILYPQTQEGERRKEYKMLTVIAAGFIGWCLLFAYSPIYKQIYNLKIQSMLKSKEPIINELNDYKKKHGVYPIRFGKYASDMYQTFNNNKDFKLHIGEYPTYYNYCTSKKIDGCDENTKKSSYQYNRTGKWIEEFYSGSL